MAELKRDLGLDRSLDRSLVRSLAVCPAAVLVLVGACRPEPAISPLPQIPVYEIMAPDSGAAVFQPVPSRDPLAIIPQDRRVSLTSSNADARTLILWLAQQAGANVVVSQDVRARVSVNFNDVPVAEAMRAVMAQAGLSFLVGDELSPWPPVVFYQLPVNIDHASAEAIAARFGISIELARWIVESRVRP